MPILINGQARKLPVTFGSAGANDVVLDSERVMPFHAALLQDRYGRLVVLTALNQDREDGRTIQAGISLIKSSKAYLRLGGMAVAIEKSGNGWIQTTLGEASQCAICKSQIAAGEPVWQCENCGMLTHDSEFCRPRDEKCFRCERR